MQNVNSINMHVYKQKTFNGKLKIVRGKYPNYTGREACTETDINLLYVDDEDKDSKENIKYMKKICFDCPTYEPCLKWALLHEVYGMWAGTTEEERMQYRKDLNIAVIDPRYIDEYMQHQDDYKKSVIE